MICSDFCPWLNKYGQCEMVLRPPARIAVCPHSAIAHKVAIAQSGSSAGGMPHDEKTS